MQHYCELEDRSLIRIGGDEAESFLQGILTCNVETIFPGQSGFGGLLTPQGKILFDFFVWRFDDCFFLDINKSQQDELMKRLIFYRLRAKVTIEVVGGGLRVFAFWGGTEPDGGYFSLVADTRLEAMGWRVIGTDFPEGEQADYDHHRIALGMPQGGVDYAYGDVFPHDALFDQIGGVDFAKGCYVGQEVISRMHHRGTARKRIIQITGENTLPPTGTKITVDDKPIGEIGSVSGCIGLAMVRLERAKDAIDANIPLVAGGVRINANIQSWVKFDWPDK